MEEWSEWRGSGERREEEEAQRARAKEQQKQKEKIQKSKEKLKNKVPCQKEVVQTSTHIGGRAHTLDLVLHSTSTSQTADTKHSLKKYRAWTEFSGSLPAPPCGGGGVEPPSPGAPGLASTLLEYCRMRTRGPVGARTQGGGGEGGAGDRGAGAPRQPPPPPPH